MYSRQVLNQFQNTRHVGDLSNADAYVRVDNPACGDILQLAIKVAQGRIAEAKFRARGCVAAIACAAQLVEMIVGKTLEDARGLQREALVEALGGLPDTSMHASHLAMDALTAAFKATGVPIPMIQVVAALIVRADQILICQRTEHQTMPLKWEFPGGKVEAGEQPNHALRRELDEELGITATIGKEVTRLQHHYPGKAVDLRFFVVPEWQGEMRNRIFHDIRWILRTELPNYEFLEADQKLIQDIAGGKLRF
jgi:8-oxo-dGTP diphosphatase